MKCLLLILFLIAGIEVTAQKIRFTDTSNRWKIESLIGLIGESCQEIAVMKMGADTTIRGLTYKKPAILYYSHRCELLNGGSWNVGGQAGANITGGYYREDTALKRVYCLSTWPGDTVEHIIFDAGWDIGDTLTWGIGASAYYKSIVAGYDSAFLNNAWHKVFRMAYAVSSGIGYDIVEGIGCTKGPGYPLHAVIPFENSDWLRCFDNAGSRPPFNLASGQYAGFNNTTTCAVSPLGIHGEIVSEPIRVVPNPGDGKTVLQMGPAVSSGRVGLVDVTGRLVATFEFQGKSEIPVWAVSIHAWSILLLSRGYQRSALYRQLYLSLMCV